MIDNLSQNQLDNFVKLGLDQAKVLTTKKRYFDNTPSLADIELLKTNKEVQENFRNRISLEHYIASKNCRILKDFLKEEEKRLIDSGVSVSEFVDTSEYKITMKNYEGARDYLQEQAQRFAKLGVNLFEFVDISEYELKYYNQDQLWNFVKLGLDPAKVKNKIQDHFNTLYLKSKPSLDDINFLKANKALQQIHTDYLIANTNSTDIDLEEQIKHYTQLGVNFFECLELSTELLAAYTLKLSRFVDLGLDSKKINGHDLVQDTFINSGSTVNPKNFQEYVKLKQQGVDFYYSDSVRELCKKQDTYDQCIKESFVNGIIGSINIIAHDQIAGEIHTLDL